jgi:Lrp/AsnC family transcriptional regulator, leucine-responsive regulatory protein
MAARKRPPPSDPWQDIARRFPAQARVFGRITRATDYGAYVELEPGVEGLVHVSEIAWGRSNPDPAQLVHPGQEVEVMVLGGDAQRHRISLGMKQCKPQPDEAPAAARSHRRERDDAGALDRIDRKLLARLQQDGRASVSQLARDVNLTVTPALERVRRLESGGYIDGYFARLNARKLGLGLLAYVEVTLDRTTPDAFERFKQVMLAHDEVMECHMVAGGFDYLLKVRVTDMESYRRFLGDRIASVRGVQQTHTYFVMEEVKSTHVIVVPN